MSVQDKETLRIKLLSKRKQQNHDVALEKSQMAQQLLLAENIWQEAKSVALYMPIAGEVDTNLLIKTAWEVNKTVLFPRCNPEHEGIMDFFVCASYADLERGSFSVLEPKPETALWQKNIDLLIVPALGFNRQGYRIGFGGGYYDRFISKNTYAFSVGLAYSWQILQEFPSKLLADWDMKVKAIASEEGIIWT